MTTRWDPPFGPGNSLEDGGGTLSPASHPLHPPGVSVRTRRPEPAIPPCEVIPMRSTMLLTPASRALLIAALVLAACSTDRPTAPVTGNVVTAATQGPDLRAATAAKQKYAAALLRQHGIEGVAVTLTTGNQPAVVVFTANA